MQKRTALVGKERETALAAADVAAEARFAAKDRTVEAANGRVLTGKGHVTGFGQRGGRHQQDSGHQEDAQRGEDDSGRNPLLGRSTVQFVGDDCHFLNR